MARPSVQLNIPPMAVRRSDVRAETAKADIRNSDGRHELMAAVLRDVRQSSRLNLDEFAQKCGKDPRQIDRMEKGERPQIEVVFAVPEFQALVLEAMAKQINHRVEVETVIRVRRTA